MKRESERPDPQLPWPESAEVLLERVPGVMSATVLGARHHVYEVRIWYEPTWPVGDVLDAVHGCLTEQLGARLAVARFQAIVARPDRRTEYRPTPEPTSRRSRPPTTETDDSIRLIGHRVEELEGGTVGVEVWIEWQGRTFSGAAVGPAVPPGSLRTPALATLRALHSCLQVLYEGPVQPGLVLESAVRTSVQDHAVAVVAVTASERARPRALTAAWAEQGSIDLAVILATLCATSRTVSRWLSEDPPVTGREEAGAPSPSPDRPRPGGRLTLVDFDVDRRASGDLDVGVRLAGFGEAIDRHRRGSDDEMELLGLGAGATLDAVHDLLRLGGWRERHHGDLETAVARRVTIGSWDLVIVLTEALMNGHRVPLAGATSADSGLERASITATLQATNSVVAERTDRILRSAWGDDAAGPGASRRA